MHFSVVFDARGWTVTEPTASTFVYRVVEARVCDALWAWGLVALRSGHTAVQDNRPRPHVVAETTFGLPWHLGVTLLSGEDRNGGSLSWVDLVYNWSHADCGRRGATAYRGQPLEQGPLERFHWTRLLQHADT